MNCRFDNNTQILDISGNSLTYLNKTSLRNMGVISLTQLNASRNSISDIHGEAFFGQSKLQTLDLSSNNLSYIEPWAFTRNPSLEWLSLSGNGFGMLPEEGYFLYSDSVRVLHLSACNLRHIPTETFQDLPNLQELYISHNLIDILPPLGTGFLTVLDVSNNNLRDLESDIFTSSPKIIRLNLSYNGLRTLNIEMLPQLAKVIRTDDLSGNPWVCDCVMFNTTYSWCRSQEQTSQNGKGDDNDEGKKSGTDSEDARKRELGTASDASDAESEKRHSSKKKRIASIGSGGDDSDADEAKARGDEDGKEQSADAAMLFGDADDITSDEVEHEAPGPKRGSGDERDSVKERSPDPDKHDENRSSVPFIGVDEAEE
ncbi:slit homolog 1 protein-like [Zootermopsis nevadensis]|uniref:slit homolog 1 protein-like n=1 Tax=Zootermopsis nevadensis TaxID=136037 RepID=UPI000B8E6DA5|nr:slit homolog 1 protein-like [Zootermopsis nevadensis]